MFEENQTPPISTDSVNKNNLVNGENKPVPEDNITCNGVSDPSNTEPDPSNNEQNDNCSQPKSSTPVTAKKVPSIPMLTINEDDDGGVVKSKPPGHSRKGSSISQHSIGCGTSSYSSLSRNNSFMSVNADTISLPLTLEQLKNDTSACTASDPALRLTADLSRDDLSDEQRHETLTKLLEEIVALKLEIVNLKEENEMLRRTRTDMDDELHQLTENLFEEAYKMVDEAKGGKADAEKKYMDAAGQIEAMETKVSALNNLLHTKPSSSSSSPNSVHKHKRTSVKKMIKKISSSKKSKKISEQRESEQLLKHGELISDEFTAFNEWLEKGSPLSADTMGANPFINSIFMSQINPCLQFKNEQLSEKVRDGVEKNMIIIEPLAGSSVDQDAFKLPCALTDDSAYPCSYRMKLGEGDVWYYISCFARNKIVSVCDFYVLVGYVQKGIVKKEPVDLFWQMTQLRGAMSLAVLNLTLPDLYS